jgi:DNA-binding transcriptional regulator LsrR (DeoR family)
VNRSSSTASVSTELLKAMSVAARMYYVQEIRQRDIAARLGVSQARVSRLLSQAQEFGVVRTMLRIPEGLHPELEEQIEQGYGLQDVHVVEVPAGNEALPYALGWAAAHFLSVGILTGPVVGFTSWSTTLQEMASAFDETLPRSGVQHLVEMLGDLGSPALQHAAARSTQRLAQVLDAEPTFLRTQGVVATPALRETALCNHHVQKALALLDELDVAFVGVGPPGLHSTLRTGDSFFTAEQVAEVEALGAVAQLNQRFLDAEGQPVVTPLDDLVVGVTLKQLKNARRRVVIAGGRSKCAAITAALRGGWVDTLMTDLSTARHLVRNLSGSTLFPSRQSQG